MDKGIQKCSETHRGLMFLLICWSKTQRDIYIYIHGCIRHILLEHTINFLIFSTDVSYKLFLSSFNIKYRFYFTYMRKNMWKTQKCSVFILYDSLQLTQKLQQSQILFVFKGKDLYSRSFSPANIWASHAKKRRKNWPVTGDT